VKTLNIDLQKTKDETGTENDLTPKFTKGNSTISNCISNIYSNDTESQRLRLWEHIQQLGSVTTIEVRRDLDVLAPAPSIYVLRHWLGYQIDTVWIYQETAWGKTHQIGKYVYCGKSKTKDLFGGAA